MKFRRQAAPSIFGTGFVALDVVVDGTSRSESLFAGGTCGNVLAIMSFLGWQATPISRLAEDAAGDLVREDLERWGVCLDHIGLEPQSPTPIVIEEIYKSHAGQAKHRYMWTCPDCDGYLPQYRPVPHKSVVFLVPAQAPQVFFFDRVSRAALDLAKAYSERGTLIVFEPSGTSDPKLFREAVRTCHILKYSSQRVKAFADLLETSNALLEIETLGEEGLRYRASLASRGGRGWTTLPSFQVEDVKDAAGSGDWCTAGILSRIGRQGQELFMKLTPPILEQALEFGQALSAWNCRFAAARGGMYFMSRAAVMKAVSKIIDGSGGKPRLVKSKTVAAQAALFCPACTVPGSRARIPRRHKMPRAV